MKRHREQKGTVYSKCGMWYVRYSDFRVIDGQLERKRLAKQLGSVDEMTKKRARDEAKDFLAGVNRPALTPETAVTLTAFVESVYLPRVEQQTRPSTFHGYQTLWKQVKPFCASFWTRDVRTRHVQGILDAMVKTDRFGINSIKHIKSFLSGIFRLAAQQGYFEGPNPARETSLPKTRAAEETYAYSLEEVLAMIDAVPEPASTLLATAAFTGVRRGELRAAAWQHYRNGALFIAHSVWNGIETEPKSRKSKAPIPVIEKLAAKLVLHRARQGNPISGPIFPNEVGKSADPNNVLQRVILPALRASELEWHGWHAFRRGLATNLNRLGVQDKTIQAILRHSNLETTMNVYVKAVNSDSVAAMQKLDMALTDTKMTPNRLAVMKPATA